MGDRVPAATSCCHQFCRVAPGRVGYLRPGWFSVLALSSGVKTSMGVSPMKSTKWMRSAVLAMGVLAVAGVMAVLACGPAAPARQAESGDSVAGSLSASATEVPLVVSDRFDRDATEEVSSATGAPSVGAQQSGGMEKETPTATPYVEPTTDPSECIVRRRREEPPKSETICAPPGPPALSHDLRAEYNDHMKEKAARHVRGETMGSPEIYVIIRTGTVDAVDDVVEFLVANDAREVSSGKKADGVSVGSAAGYVKVELLYALAEIEGVTGVYEPGPRKLSSLSRQGGSRQTAAGVMQADQWHRAGFTGAGVEVAVLDSDFTDFRARIVPLLSQPVNFLCYGADGVPREGQISAASALALGDPAGSFAACETSSIGLPVPLPGDRPHGTEVVEDYLEIAPDVKLYISNPSSSMRMTQVLKWLTAGDSDDVPGTADYNVAGNNEFNVRIINHSITELWKGPGDGTSPFDIDRDRSLLNFVRNAVGEGVLWVNAAGNAGLGTWFKRGIDDDDFDDAGRLKFNSAGLVCNPVTIESDRDYFFQMRWNGPWPRASIDLALFLVNQSDDVVASSNDLQSGLDMQFPNERLFVGAGTVPTGMMPTGMMPDGTMYSYCLEVLKVSSVATLEWVQLQMFGGNDPVSLGVITTEGSLEDPADSNSPGMLAVGAADGGSPPLVRSHSSKGPAPEPYPYFLDPPGDERIALDLVGATLSGESLGTSNAVPRVAGEAALLIQALGDRVRYDEPAEIARYMKNFGSTRRLCDNEWGCGFAMLPPLDPPTNLRLESTSNTCHVDRQQARHIHNLRVTFDPPTNGNHDIFVPYAVDLKKVGDPDTDTSGLRRGSGHARLPGGDTYVARAYTCAAGFGGDLVCGQPSVESNELSVPREVCKPVMFDVISGDGMLTLRWDAQPDATGYEVERVNDDGSTVPVSDERITDQHFEVRGLTNGEYYGFRVRAVGPSGTSDWSEPSGIAPRRIGSLILSPIGGLRDETNSDWTRQFDAVFGWLYGGRSALHEVRVREVGSAPWNVLSSDPEVAGDGARVVFWSDHYVVRERRLYAGLVGLTPGTEYELQVRGINGDKSSPWTDTVSFTTLGRRPVESTPRPSVPEALRVGSSSGQPFPRVVLRWDESGEDYLHEIRMVGGPARDWGRLQFGASGSSSPHVVRYFGGSGVFIAGLTPGTEYHFAVRAAKKRNSSETTDYSPWSKPVTVTTTGTRPADAPGSATAPALKAPPEDLMAEVSGTTVNLMWTATTNPNYTSQRLLRRVTGVSPIQWTEIPLAVDVTAYTDTGLTSGITYRYRVRAYKDNGNYGEQKGGFADAVIP